MLIPFRSGPGELPLGPATFRSWLLIHRLSDGPALPRLQVKPPLRFRRSPIARLYALQQAPVAEVKAPPRQAGPPPSAKIRTRVTRARPAPSLFKVKVKRPRASNEDGGGGGSWLAPAALIMALSPLAVWAGLLVYAQTHFPAVLARHESLIDAATAVQGRDARGRLVFALRQPGSTDDRLIIRYDHPVPADLSRMLVTLEDRHAENASLRHWFGLDIGSLVASGTCKMLKPHVSEVPILRSMRCGGTSSLLMLATRGTYQFVGGQHSGVALRDRKTMEIIDTIALSLMGRLDEPRAARFIVDRLPLAIGPDGTVWGVETASEVLWGSPTDHLSTAQLAVLASMPKTQMWLTCPGDDPKYVAGAQARWDQIKTRGLFALRRSFAPNAKLDAALAELATMPMPTPRKLDAGLTQGLSPRDACIAAASLARRGALVSSSLALAARSELAGLPVTSGEVVREIQLTVDAVRNRDFKLQIERAVRAAQTDQRRKLHIPLASTGDRAADLLLVVTDARGAIMLHYNNKARNLLNEARRPGSPGKLAVVMAAAQLGADPQGLLCNERDRLTGVRNADGDIGAEACEGSALVGWDNAVGRSLNLPLLKEARDLGDVRVRKAAEDFGMTLPDGVPVANAVVLGQGLITPRRLQGAIQAIGRAAAGETAVAETPYVIERARIGARWVTPDRGTVDLQPYFKTPTSRALALAAAGGPLRVQGGTLTGAVSAGAPVSPVEIAKSGTVAGAPPQRSTISKLALGANVGPRRLSYLGLVAAPRGSLGDEVSVISLWRLLRAEAELGSGTAPSQNADAGKPQGSG